MELHFAAPLNEADNHAFECLLIADATGSYFHFFKASAVGTVIVQRGKVGGTAPLAALKEAAATEMANE